MNTPRPTPETQAAIMASKGAWSFELREKMEKLERERDDLARWKEEQMFIESQWDAQAVAKELEMPIGVCIRRNILPSVIRLKQERDEALERINELEAKTIHSCHNQCQRPGCKKRREIEAMREVIKEAVRLLGLFRHFLRSVKGDTANCDSTIDKLSIFLK
jgi:hypothetical protein